MLFKKSKDHPSPQMFYGTLGVWQMDPHVQRCHKSPNPQQMWFYMMPMVQGNWHQSEHKPHWGCHGRRRWKHGQDHHEMNPEKFNEVMKEIQAKENYINGYSFHHRHRHGFCRRTYSKNEQKQDPNSEFFFEKHSLHSNIN